MSQESISVNPPYLVRQLNESDADQVSRLRVDAYLHSGYGLTHPKLMYWGPSDRRFMVWGTFHQNDLIASLRVDTLKTSEEMSYYLQNSADEFGVTPPCIALSRAVTRPDFRGQGHWKLLRGLAIQWALKQDINFLVTTLVDDGKSALLIRTGHDVTPSSPWKDFIRPHGEVIKARLNLREKGEFAAQVLFDEIKKLRQQAHIQLAGFN